MKPRIELPALVYLDPTTPMADRDLFVPAVGALEGRWVAFVDNGWTSFGKVGARMADVLKQRHRIAGLRVYPVPTSPGPPDEVFDRIAAECDAAVVGLAN